MSYQLKYFYDFSDVVDFLTDNHISKDRIIYLDQIRVEGSRLHIICLIYLG